MRASDFSFLLFRFLRRILKLIRQNFLRFRIVCFGKCVAGQTCSWLHSSCACASAWICWPPYVA